MDTLSLTATEKEVMGLIGEGLNYPRIAAKTGRSVSVIHFHANNVRLKIKAPPKVTSLWVWRYCLLAGLIEPPKWIVRLNAGTGTPASESDFPLPATSPDGTSTSPTSTWSLR